MLLNLSNHPSSTWLSDQINDAQLAFGEVLDLPFPPIEPNADTDFIVDLAQKYAAACIEKLKSDKGDSAVHVMGEMVFTFHVVNILKKSKIRCVASTTRRITSETGNNKLSQFDFVRFRDY